MTMKREIKKMIIPQSTDLRISLRLPLPKNTIVAPRRETVPRLKLPWIPNSSAIPKGKSRAQLFPRSSLRALLAFDL
jgi:hypothetical protein